MCAPSFARRATPNAAGVATGHIQINATDVDFQAAGIKTDAAIRSSTNTTGLRIVFITDPWGTEIELTEGLATTPVAGSK